ncbi:MAG: thioredoxin TrxC [Xanthomonadales bacterium]|nr:Thioredoxin 2 [Xanthomonadales bacterium]MCC6592522.1 thioredoxin TrxC [Xanthomonadales bacterium]MCE7931498.1 thioredoxin TrxC [Xanthomonadales bacterium PRO6]
MSEPSLHIVCPSCLSTNRVPLARLEARPQCGRCKSALFQGRPLEVDAEGFRRLREHSEQPVLVDFWAPWCGPCLQMAPQLAAATQRLEPQLRVAKVDVQAQQDIGAELRIQSIPTLALFHGGREIARTQGAMGAMEIVRFVAEALA